MLKRTQMDYENILGMTQGKGIRKLDSWIASFIDQTINLDSPAIYRRWTAISLIAAVLEQKVWMQTSEALYPNLYIFIVGDPGVGKTRVIKVAKRLANSLRDFHIAPISMTWASCVDAMASSKRYVIVDPPNEPLQFNSMYICADELGAFMGKYDNEMIDGLSAFYDPTPYQQTRRTMDHKIEITSPQVSLLAGCTPSNLTDFMPDKAWGQGFTSRLIMIYSNEKIIGDDFAARNPTRMEALEHDLKIIYGLFGEFNVTQEYVDCINNWRQCGEPPLPNHPKLTHYITRRKTHLYKLSMVSSVDRGNSLSITREDFNRAMNWMVEAETLMPEIFESSVVNGDSLAQDEILHFIKVADKGQGVSELRITNFARSRVPITSILRIIDIMVASGLIHYIGTDRRTGVRHFSANKLN